MVPKKLWDGLKNPCHQTSHPFYYIFRPHKDQNTPTLSKILLVTSPLDPPYLSNLSLFLCLYEIWFFFGPPPTYMIDVIKYPHFFF